MDYDLGNVDLEERTLQPLGETTKRFTPKNEQVNISHELRKIFMYFFITNLFGVVAAAI